MNDRTKAAQSLKKVIIYVFFFICISSLLIFSNWDSISAFNIEVGDFAANSLLIQDAKSFNLWVGNYSRVGFNHPGPAILLVLTAGEMLFYDTLHTVNSPLSGQLLAVAFYNALWITLAFGALTKITQSTRLAIIAVCVLIASLAIFDFQIFNGIWFPHLYVLPFAVMLIAASRLANGQTDLMQTLAISSGFLINGHVSFIAILGIIFITALASNWKTYKNQDNGKSILKKSFLQAHALSLIAGVATLFLFFIPIIIQTIIEFPGPVASYAAFSGGHQPNSLMDAIRFTSAYWGGIGPFLIGICVILILPRLAKLGSLQSYESTKAFSYTMLGSTLAILFYAKYGVDLLDQKYIGLFYFSTPALTASYIAIAIIGLFKSSPIEKTWPIVAIIAAIFLVQVIKKPALYAHLYKQPEVITLYSTIKNFPHQGQLVLDLDNTGDWGNIWSSILGVEAYAKRNHESLFCIRKNWHISFTKVARCTDVESVTGTRLFVSNQGRETGNGNPAFSGMGLSFYAMKTPTLSAGKYDISSNHNLFREYILPTGWSNVEQDFVWSDGKESHIEIKLPESFSGKVSLDLGAFLPTSKYVQTVTVYSNEIFISDISISSANPRKTVDIPVVVPTATPLKIKLVIHQPISPKKAGLSADGRDLGVSLYGLQIQEDQK